MASLRLCILCHVAPRRNIHANTKYCTACRHARLHQPASHLTPTEAEGIARLRGTMPRKAIAETLGISHAKVQRYLREQHLSSNVRDYPPAVVDAVCTVYESAPRGAGRRRAQEAFPAVRVRSIVERRTHHRPSFQRRQVRWTGSQFVEAARMAGLVSPEAQARYFGRPNAFNGSIKALWAKRFHCPARDINGLAAHTVWPLCGPGAPAVLVHYQPTSGPRAMVLWQDLAQHLRPEIDGVLREAILGLARFQQWLHGGATSTAIAQMIQEREQTWRSA